MILHDLAVPITDFERGTGWQLKPEGACRGDVCIPLHDAAPATDDAADRSEPAGTVDVTALAERMGLPLVHDPDHDVWALGPWSGSGRALVSAEAPELVLPDLDGDDFALSSLRGQKVLILSWAPY